jgi:hypothetical protein
MESDETQISRIILTRSCTCQRQGEQATDWWSEMEPGSKTAEWFICIRFTELEKQPTEADLPEQRGT